MSGGSILNDIAKEHLAHIRHLGAIAGAGGLTRARAGVRARGRDRA
jgi:hypothetical protein